MEAQKIAQTMTIGDVLTHFPTKSAELAQVMTEAGLHCVGCHASPFETLEEGILGHGMPAETLNALVQKLNDVVNKEEEISMDGSVVTLTSAAVTKVKEVMKEEGVEGQGLRVTVVPGGCAGFSYDLSFQPNPETGDIVANYDGLQVFVDQNSVPHLKGIEIDFVSTLKESGFKFNNPQAKQGCGCGSSFS